jgi:hypothetical protein
MQKKARVSGGEGEKQVFRFVNSHDKIDIMRAIYIFGVVQYLAILGSMLALIVLVNKSRLTHNWSAIVSC